MFPSKMRTTCIFTKVHEHLDRRISRVFLGNRASTCRRAEGNGNDGTSAVSLTESNFDSCPMSSKLRNVSRTAGTWGLSEGHKDAIAERTSEPAQRAHEKSENDQHRKTAPREIPEVCSIPILRKLPWFLFAGGPSKIHEYVNRKHKELGPIFRTNIGPVNGIFVNSPDEFRRVFRIEGSHPKHFLPEPWILYNQTKACQRGLLFMDQEEWLHYRRILNKILLLRDPTEMVVGPCYEAAEALSKSLMTFTESGGVVTDPEMHLYRWSSEAMLSMLMGSSWTQHRARMSHESSGLAQSLREILECTSRLSVMPPTLAMSLNLPQWRKFVNSVDSALSIVRTVVPEMIKLAADDGLLKAMISEGIRDEYLVRIIGDFMFAGSDTTTYSTEWALYMLATHPEIQNELSERVQDLTPREIVRDALAKGIVKETLRLYPTAVFISRYLPEDSLIADYHVQRGELILLSLYSSGRDPANFPRPNDFYPERWIRTEEGNYRDVIHPHASIPFAMGARSCVGRKLAETQMALGLSQLARTFRIECSNRKNVTINMCMLPMPSEPIHLKLKLR